MFLPFSSQRFRPGIRPLLAFAAALCLGTALDVAAQQDFSDVTIERTKVAEGIYFLEGAGGNLMVSVGDDGAFLIDDQYAPLTDKIEANIREMTDKPVRFIVNTHFHGDHTGGNEAWGSKGTIIAAHENVRKRLMTEQHNAAFDRTTPAAPAAAWPVITFDDDITFHFNGNDMHVFHIEDAHTDGDAMVHVTNANVLHMGDVYFNGLYPFIDFSSGGSIYGVIAAVEKVLEMVDGDTVIIPGHGPISNRTGLETYLAMLIDVKNTIQELLDDGKSVDEVVAAKPTQSYDKQWGGGFLNPDNFVSIVVQGMSKR